jgi:hypothetical protein
VKTARFAGTLDLLLELMQGMALSRTVAPDPAHERRILALATDLARAALRSGDAAAATDRAGRRRLAAPRGRKSAR